MCRTNSNPSVEVHGDGKNPALLSILLSLIDMTQPSEVQDEACYAIANLMVDCKQIATVGLVLIFHAVASNADFRKMGGLKALMKLLSGTELDVQKNAAYALTVILKDCTAKESWWFPLN